MCISAHTFVRILVMSASLSLLGDLGEQPGEKVAVKPGPLDAQVLDRSDNHRRQEVAAWKRCSLDKTPAEPSYGGVRDWENSPTRDTRTNRQSITRQ
jgi:hypothetical protein